MGRVGLAGWQETNGLLFNDVNLLRRALTHPSYVNEHPTEGYQDNQRLEFLGDAVLAFVSGEWLYTKFPDATEGQLTRLRAALVRTEMLASFARECYVGDSLFVGKGEEESGGKERDANLCDAFEAIIGALYLDQGLDVVRVFIYPRFETAVADTLRDERDKDAKSRLQEWSQRQLGLTPIYDIVLTQGPDHAKQFTVTVRIGEKIYGEGTGPRKQVAEQAAAMHALESLRAISSK